MYKLTIEYDGTNLLGWQKQPEGNTVQGFLEQAIYRLSQEKVEVYGAGRTDAGVHAISMVAHADIKKDLSLYQLKEGINFHLMRLNAPVAVLDITKAEDDFHARFSALSRSYIYKIINRKAPLVLQKNRAWHVSQDLDVAKMQKACKHFLGKHDFSSFRAAQCQAHSPIKTIDVFEIKQDKENIEIFIKAQSFLHNQVRNMVGAIKEVGVGRLSPEDITKILELKDRTKAPVCAPAHGLYFYKVEY